MIKILTCRKNYLALLVFIVACSDQIPSTPQTSDSQTQPLATSQAVAPPVTQGNSISAVETAQIQIRVQQGFYAEGRPAADLEAHSRRKAEQVIAWAGITEAMEVIDIDAGSGYYSENLAWAVGLDGWVIAQNTPGALDQRGGANRTTLEQRLLNHRLPQIEAVEMDYSQLPQEFEELHAATMVNTFHDLYHAQGEAAALQALQSIYQVLAPSGFLILIDHLGRPDNNNAELHRIDPAIVRDLLQRSGFSIAEESDLLAMPSDNPDLRIFDDSVRGKTHRFILKAIKPAG